jgi:hypothetical protein
VQFFADPSSELRYTVKNTSTAVGQVIKKYTLIDVDGKPLASFKVFTLSPAVNSDTSRYIQQLQTDSSGVLLLDTSQIACISFDRFNANRLSKDNHFKWEQLSAIAGNTITIQFNYPGFCLQYPDIQVAGSLPGLKRKTGEDELIDGTGNLYIKQKF